VQAGAGPGGRSPRGMMLLGVWCNRNKVEEDELSSWSLCLRYDHKVCQPVLNTSRMQRPGGGSKSWLNRHWKQLCVVQCVGIGARPTCAHKSTAWQHMCTYSHLHPTPTHPLAHHGEATGAEPTPCCAYARTRPHPRASS
jgi:hypothetical protein